MPYSPFPSVPPMEKQAMDRDDDRRYVDSIYSRSNASTTSFVSYNAYDDLPPFRLPKIDGDKEVYEAWTVYLSSDYDDPIFARKSCGITTTREYDSYPGTVSSISELYDQQELMGMHVAALDKYKTKSKRAWPSRVVRGKPASYEDDVDARIRKLPGMVQSEICRLLSDREDASSNRFHNRAWTVVAMQEQLHRRFANDEPKVIDKRHKVRFWKNPGKRDRSEYFVIIRGREGRRISDHKGQTEFKRFENPWIHADEEEARRKTREELDRMREKRAKTVPPPSYRYSPPPPPPLPTFPRHGSLYSAPGAYSRSRMSPAEMGMPPPGFPMPVRAGCSQPPPAPTPPVSYPPPPSVQHARDTDKYFGGPRYSASAPNPLPSRYSPILAPPSPPLCGIPPPTNPGASSFGSTDGPYTYSCRGGPYNGLQEREVVHLNISAPRPPHSSFGQSVYTGRRPSGFFPGPAGRFVSHSAPNPVSDFSRETLPLKHHSDDDDDDDEFYRDGMHLCGPADSTSDDRQDGASAPSAQFTTAQFTTKCNSQPVNTTEHVEEYEQYSEAKKNRVEACKERHRARREEYNRKMMNELIAANARRNEEAKLAREGLGSAGEVKGEGKMEDGEDDDVAWGCN